MKFISFIKRIDWVNMIFLFSSPLIAFGGTTFLIMVDGIRVPTVALGLIMAIVTGLAITAGYHRLFSHKSFEATPLFKLIVLLFGAAAFENSALRWSSDHRNHHKFVDTDKDPYNINRGFFFAHMGWVCLKYNQSHQYDNVPDLAKDPLVQFQDRHIMILGILIGFAFPMFVASFWGDALGGLLIGGFLRLVLNHHFTFSINSFCHMIGRQPYSDSNTARDSWILALFTYGEGYHNFHHKFPTDYRNGIRPYHWDPTKWIVKCLSWFGVTYQLRKISDIKIVLARLRMNEKRLLRRLEKQPALPPVTREFISTARLKFEDAYVRFQTLKKEYEVVKAAKLDAWSTQMFNLKTDLHRAQISLHNAFSAWKDLCRSYGVRPVRIPV